jgi:general secretion pathway protein J
MNLPNGLRPIPVPQRLRPLRTGTQGFTLIEILVALVILGILTTLAYSAIGSIRRAFETTEAQEERMREVELAVHTLQNDWFEADPEPIRDGLGQNTLPAVQVDPRTLNWFSLTHGGVGTGLGIQRGSQQRVTYRLEGDQLIRETDPVLNAAQSVLPTRRVLLHHVTSVHIKLNTGTGAWVEEWPTPASLTQPNVAARTRPALVEFTLVLQDLGSIHRLVEVAH